MPNLGFVSVREPSLIPMDDIVSHVLTAFGIPPHLTRLTDLGSGGGFSGAQLWRVELVGTKEELCLRRWPLQQQDAVPLQAIHRAQQFAAQQLVFVPKLNATHAGETLVHAAGAWWELSAWLAGAADYHAHPSSAKLGAALQALAKLHQRWAEFRPGNMTSHAPPPTILRRLARLETLLSTDERAIRRALETHTPSPTLPGLAFRAEQLLEFFTDLAPATHDQLVRAAVIAVPLQTCLRDVWHDHILFTGDEVSGIVDYGAVGWDSVATDVARLAGSLARDDADAWRTCLAAYQQIRALSTDELVLVEVCDAANVLLSGMNWLEWLLVERRQFDGESRILARLDETLARLVHRKHQRGIWYAD